MFALVVALASANLTPAQPLKKQGWLGAVEYPAEAKRHHKEGVVFFDLIIAPDGRPIDCKIKLSSGSSILDDQTCSNALKSAKLKPALDETGTPIHAVQNGLLVWSLGSKFLITRPPDIAVNVTRLPDNKKELLVTVHARTDTVGQVVACDHDETDRMSILACEQVTSAFRSLARVDKRGSQRAGVLIQGCSLRSSHG
ncbi:energy transducer TonB, partial [Sphingobium sp. MK2]|uniref:energy transducer TonB n=1 Tax=Sphingobium sp. MK2 TaxID=3116540 RepID=UPI0032E3631F